MTNRFIGKEILSGRTVTMGVSAASFVALLQMLQIKVPPAPAALGISVIAFSVSLAMGVFLALTLELWWEAIEEDLPGLRRPWWAVIMLASTGVSVLVGVVGVVVHVYPGHAAWIAFSCACYFGLVWHASVQKSVTDARRAKAASFPKIAPAESESTGKT